MATITPIEFDYLSKIGHNKIVFVLYPLSFSFLNLGSL